jgi:hypothetical protein
MQEMMGQMFDMNLNNGKKKSKKYSGKNNMFSGINIMNMMDDDDLSSFMPKKNKNKSKNKKQSKNDDMLGMMMDMMGSNMMFGGNMDDINDIMFGDDDINDMMFMNSGSNLNMLNSSSHVYKPTYK